MRNRIVLATALCALTVFLAARQVGSAFSIEAHAGSTSAVAPQDVAEPVEESMHEFMEYVFQPTYLRLRENLRQQPADNRGWKPLKSDSLILAESCNLLFDRKPDEDGEDWIRHAAAARRDGAAVYAAAKARDFEATVTSFKTMLNSCNGCHRQFENGKHILTP